MPIIEINNLTKDYGAVRAVDDLSFSIEERKIVGFLGPNGSGKTTTLRSLLGLVEPTSGMAHVNGRPYRELAAPLNEVGVMLHAAAHPARTARNHLRVLAAEAGTPASRVGELLELVDLVAAADRKVGGFSLGMKQRLGLAGALIGNPALLVLDEPANGLDPEGMRWLRDFLRSLAGEGHTVLLSSHVLAEVAQTADDVVVIAAGRLVTHAPLEQLTATHENRRVRVRSSDPSQLAAALRSRGLATEEQAAGALLVAGATAALVGETAFDAQLVLHELTEDASSLEDIFLNITNPAEEALR